MDWGTLVIAVFRIETFFSAKPTRHRINRARVCTGIAQENVPDTMRQERINRMADFDVFDSQNEIPARRLKPPQHAKTPIKNNPSSPLHA